MSCVVMGYNILSSHESSILSYTQDSSHPLHRSNESTKGLNTNLVHKVEVSQHKTILKLGLEGKEKATYVRSGCANGEKK